MRYIFLTALIFTMLHCPGQNTVSSDPGAQFPFLKTIQDFVDKNEASNLADSIRQLNLYRKLKEELPAYRSSVSAFIILYYWGLNLTRAQADTLYHYIDTSLYNKPEKGLADAILQRIAAAETGKPFPPLVLTDTAGKELSIDVLKGKTVLIDAWSSWCGPCREQIPALRKLYRKFNAKGFEIIGVSMDKEREKWLAAIKKDKQEWRQFCELTGWMQNKFAARFHIYGIPANFLIDKNGILVGQDLTPETIATWLEQHQ